MIMDGVRLLQGNGILYYLCIHITYHITHCESNQPFIYDTIFQGISGIGMNHYYHLIEDLEKDFIVIMDYNIIHENQVKQSQV